MNNKREAVLQAAAELFSEYGYHAVGVDAIVAKSKVAKMTFYKHFSSKDILIENVLIRRDLELRKCILEATTRAKTPLLKIKAIFNWYQIWFNSPDFHGCMFIKVSEEFPERGSRVKNVSLEYKSWLAGVMEGLLELICVKNSHEISLHLVVLLDGLTVGCNLNRGACNKQIQAAWRYARQVILSQKKEAIVTLPTE